VHCSLVVFEHFPLVSLDSASAAAGVEVLTVAAVPRCLTTLAEQRCYLLVGHLVTVGWRGRVSVPYYRIVGGWHLGLADEGEAPGKPCPFGRWGVEPRWAMEKAVKEAWTTS